MTGDSSPGRFDLSGSNILVTGGTGSFGRRFVHRLLNEHDPARVVVFSRDEDKQYDMALSLPQSSHPSLRYFIGDVRDQSRLELAMRDIDVVIHAAALKHVPTAEYNPFECIRTNVHGAENVVQAALRTEVKRVIALSTDKASNPINLYGASKLASDKIFVAANNVSGSVAARFSVVRYGNVIGSRGSIVPMFRRLIAEGVDALPITDERMTRFWITLDQGIDFVIRCITDMQGGEIFIPKIPSMKVVDIASAMAPDLPHRVIGIRPGEKLHEIMVTTDDARLTLELEDRYIIEPDFAFWRREGYESFGATRVASDFSYASDKNDHWLDRDAFRALLED